MEYIEIAIDAQALVSGAKVLPPAVPIKIKFAYNITYPNKSVSMIISSKNGDSPEIIVHKEELKKVLKFLLDEQ